MLRNMEMLERSSMSGRNSTQPSMRSVSDMKNHVLIGALMFCFATVSQSVAEVVDGPNGPVEFIGLEQWTASELFKAIQETSPETKFHACAAVMISELDFADAAAMGFIDSFEDGSWQGYTVVVGIEDSSDVRYRTAGNESLDLPDAWRKVQAIFENDFSTLATVAWLHLIAPNDEETARSVAEQLGASGEKFDEMWTPVKTLVENPDESTDHQLALEVLETDASWSARAVATIVLAHDHDSDSSWHGLTDSLIDAAPQVRNTAQKMIDGLMQSEKSKPVQWSEVRETLVALFSGTYPWAFNEILETLVATKVDPEFGRALLQEAPDLLLAYAGAKHEKFGKPAQDFLSAVSGENFGGDVEAWSEWLKETATEEDDP